MPTPHRRVVIVDDDESMRRAMHRVLALGDFEPEAFASSEAALASPRLPEAACLVLDIQLPGLSGFELFDHLVTTGTRPTVIFITSFDEPRARRQAAARNAAGFLTKPFTGTAVVRLVEEAINSSQQGYGSGS